MLAVSSAEDHPLQYEECHFRRNGQNHRVLWYQLHKGSYADTLIWIDCCNLIVLRVLMTHCTKILLMCNSIHFFIIAVAQSHFWMARDPQCIVGKVEAK